MTGNEGGNDYRYRLCMNFRTYRALTVNHFCTSTYASTAVTGAHLYLSVKDSGATLLPATGQNDDSRSILSVIFSRLRPVALT